MSIYRPTIETLDDWNAAIAACGCCEMPECPVPVQECESIEAPLCGFSLPSHPDVTDTCVRYTTKTVSYSHSTYYETTDAYGTSTYDENENSTATTVISLSETTPGDFSCQTQYGQTSTYTLDEYIAGPTERYVGQSSIYTAPLGSETALIGPTGGPYTVVIYSTEDWTTYDEYPPDPRETDSGTNLNVQTTFNDADPDSSWTFVSPSTFTKTIVVDSETTNTYSVTYSGDISTSLESYDFATSANGNSCTAILGCETAIVRKTRYRWAVPDTWTGSYFKVTWDVVEEPDGWDADPPTALRSFVSQDNTWEWTGPGDPEDADSWKSGWYEIAPPSVPGTRRVVNIRFECYRNSPYGNKPQITGEGVSLPDP